PLMRTLAVAMLFRAIVVLTGQLLDGVGRPHLTLRLNAGRLAVLAIVLIPLAAGAGVRGVPDRVLRAHPGGAWRSPRAPGRGGGGGGEGLWGRIEGAGWHDYAGDY